MRRETEVQALARELRENDDWNFDQCKTLCPFTKRKLYANIGGENIGGI